MATIIGAPDNQIKPEYNQTELPYKQTELKYNQTHAQYNQTEPPYNQTEPAYNQTEPWVTFLPEGVVQGFWNLGARTPIGASGN